jgi:hypothetical protein
LHVEDKICAVTGKMFLDAPLRRGVSHCRPISAWDAALTFAKDVVRDLRAFLRLS